MPIFLGGNTDPSDRPSFFTMSCNTSSFGLPRLVLRYALAIMVDGSAFQYRASFEQSCDPTELL